MKKIKLLNPDGSLHGEYELFEKHTIEINSLPYHDEELTNLGFKIEEVEEERFERWINLYGGRLNGAHYADEDTAIENKAGPARTIHFVELKPGEKILSRKQVEDVANRYASTFAKAILKDLGFKEQVMKDGDLCKYGFLFLKGCCCPRCAEESRE